MDTSDQPKDQSPKMDTSDTPKGQSPTMDTTDKPKSPTMDTSDKPKGQSPTVETSDKTKGQSPTVDTGDKTRVHSSRGETAASVVVAVGFIFILYQAVLAGLPQLLLGVVAVSVVFSVWVEQSSTQPALLKVHWQWILREKCGKGVWCCLLVPTAVIVSCFKKSTIDDREAMLLMFCVSMMVMGLLTCETAANKPMMDECEATEADAEDECICIPAVILLERKYLVLLIGILVFYGLIVFRLTMWQYSGVCLFTLLVGGLLIIAPRWFPHSFTMGENVICTQALSLFLFSIALGVTPAKSNSNIQEKTTAQVLAFMQVAVLSCIFVAGTVAVIPQCRGIKQFVCLLLSVAMAISLPLLYWHLGQNFVIWLVHYILDSVVKQCLFAFWSAGCIIAVAIVYVNSQRIKRSVAAEKRKPDLDQGDSPGIHKTAEKTDDKSGHHKTVREAEDRPGSDGSVQNRDSITADRQNVSILARKLFHLLMLCVFVPGLVFHAEMLTLASSCALGVFILAGCIHLWRIPPFGDVLHEWLQVFVDDRDRGAILLTPLYLLVGLSLPLWLHSLGSGVTLCVYSGVLSTGLGDMVAAVIGSNWGSHRWPGTKKTMEGTTASVVAQLLAVYIIFYLGVCPQIGWLQVTVAVVLTSLLEAWTSQIDNLVLPLFMYSLLAI